MTLHAIGCPTGARVRVPIAVCAALLFATLPTRTARAQGADVRARVERVGSGTVRMVYAPRAGVCGDGMTWYRTTTGSRTSMTGSFYTTNGRNRDVEVTCQQGPVRVVIVRAEGVTREIRTYVGGRWKADTAVIDLGVVPAGDASRWLLDLAEHADERVAAAAMSAATLADSVDATAPLLRIVGDVTRPSGIRSAALHWLGDVAGDKIAQRLDSIAYEPGDRELREQAIYTVSRRPADEAYPALTKMAETLPDRELRKTAVYWLARVKDPRALAWITKQIER